MDFYDNDVNRRIMSGSFPTKKLYPSTIEPGRVIDFDAHAESMMSLFTEKPEVLSTLFILFSWKADELEICNNSEFYIQPVNNYINAQCSDDYLKVNGSWKSAFDIVPVVTPLDKVLWVGSCLYHTERTHLGQSLSGDFKYDPTSMMFAWIKLLNLAQCMEVKTKRTIKVNQITSSTNILDLINNGFQDSTYSRCTRKLSMAEIDGLNKLMEQRNALHKEIQNEIDIAKTVSAKTQSEWELFLKIVNDISEKEAHVISRINDSLSTKDKLRAIHEYENIVNKIKKLKYDLGEDEINLLDVFKAVNNRMLDAQTFACARMDKSDSFRVHPALFLLTSEPYTYNYLFMMFHQFRLNSNKDNAKKFVSLALTSIKKNLGNEESNPISLDEMITSFYETVHGFMRANDAALERLSFKKLQPDTVVVEGTSLEAMRKSSVFHDEIVSKTLANMNDGTLEKELERLATGNLIGLDEARIQQKEVDLWNTQVNEDATAWKLVLSLNIIYMFCDALRIMLTNKHSNIQLKNKDDVKQYRKELLKLDDRLVHKVYAHMDEQEIGMLEYREKAGIITSTLSEQEIQEEKYRNSIFADILRDAIEQLTAGIETLDSEQILQTKARIREEILQFPECDDKEYYAKWLDSVSDRISSALVNNCKKQTDDYLGIKEKIQTALGISSKKLPASTLDSLTTAEMLYGRYASDEYAEKGFDFSCISALYYQAFEDAYNDLIWHQYANMLNKLVIDGQKYTEFLDINRTKIKDPNKKGYLDENGKQRGYYINYKNRTNPQTTVSMRCMYKSFSILMENIQNPSPLNKFCEYFARLTGYVNRQAMFEDTTFMTKCRDFTNAVSKSADNRNNASHGGTFISVAQCSKDKKAVLNDLEAVRLDSIGLIQQLLYLLNRA